MVQSIAYIVMEVLVNGCPVSVKDSVALNVVCGEGYLCVNTRRRVVEGMGHHRADATTTVSGFRCCQLKV